MIRFEPPLTLAALDILQPPFTTNPAEAPPEPGQVVGEDWATIPGLEGVYTLGAAGAIEVTGHVGFQIQGTPGFDDKFLLAVRVRVDGTITQESENERRDEHYEDRDISVIAPASAGPHVVEVQARAVLKSGRPETKVCVKERQYARIQVKLHEPPAPGAVAGLATRLGRA
jgi:hypothetical protein